MIDYLDILGRPWDQMNCQDAVRCLYGRAGIDLPEDALSRAVGGWELVGTRWTDASQVLDVIASDPECVGCESHLSVIVKADPPRLAVTSSAANGVATTPVWAIQRVLGVYRWVG